MSGKGKGKGKGKRKDKIKPKPKRGEIELFNKCIDLKRFAYDVIKYSALKFRVPESCIAVWDDKRNDYGRDDFCFVLCVRILKYQITYRGLCHAYFSQRYEENKLADSELIGGLLYDVIRDVTLGFEMSPIRIVLISLCIACELFLFLYSKDVASHPKKLAKLWLGCYLNTNKKDFENLGGLEEIYRRTNKRKCAIMNAVLNKFIEDHCLPYNSSVNNPDLQKLFCYAINESLSPKDKEEFEKEVDLVNEIVNQFLGIKIVEPPAPDGATGINLPESTGTPLDQASQFCGSFVASQDLPVTIPEVQTRPQRTLSTEERRKLLKDKSPFKQDIRQLILESLVTKQSSDQKPSVSIATGTAQSYEHQGVKPKVPLQNTGSSGLQTGESSSRSSWKQSLGQLNSDSSGTE